MLAYERGKLWTIINKLEDLHNKGDLNDHERDLLEAAKSLLLIAFRTKNIKERP